MSSVALWIGCFISFLFSVCIYLLLLPTYHSTDLDVHRNWKSITYHLTPSQWYFENTSPWTLDYPPFFAYLEWVLAHVASFIGVDKSCLAISALPNVSSSCKVYLRASVIVSTSAVPFVVFGMLRSSLGLGKSQEFNIVDRFSQGFVFTTAILQHPALVLIDHLHFQYNGFLLSILLFSVMCLLPRTTGNPSGPSLWHSPGYVIMSAAAFSSLLCFKHLFLAAAPAFFIFLLRYGCFEISIVDMKQTFYLSRVLILGCVVMFIVTLAFLPLIWSEINNSAECSNVSDISCWIRATKIQLSQIVLRLFPFERGLSHAYWAPNIWAIYNACDRLLVAVIRRTSSLSVPYCLDFLWPYSVLNHLVALTENSDGALTAGIIGTRQTHAILPTISPIVTALLSLIAMLPVLYSLWRYYITYINERYIKKSSDCYHPSELFIFVLAHGTLSTFVFGWHVHEKAILVPVILLTVPALSGGFSLYQSTQLIRLFYLLSVTASVSVLPLLPTYTLEYIFIVCLILIYHIFLIALFNHRLQSNWLSSNDILYSIGMIGLEVVCSVILPFCCSSWPFLPLLLRSVCCSFGILVVWFRLSVITLVMLN